MNLLLIIPLLLLDTRTGWAHSLARIEDAQNEVNTTQSQDVYEVKDGSSSLQFVYPKQKQPTLREIIYYHVIERPYDEKTVLHEEAPYSDVNVRHFTNSHAGYQFLGPELDKEPTQNIPENLEIPDEDLGYEEFIKVPDSKVGTTTTEEPEYEIVYIDEVENDGIESTTEMAGYSVTDVDEDLKNDDNHTTEQSENMQIEIEPVKRTRNLLFDRVKEKYSTKHNERENTSTVALKRRKRDLTGEIPEAPKLEDLDLDSLPPHIRNMVAVGQNYFKTPNKKDEELSEIRQKIKGVFDKLDGTKETTGVPTSKTYGMRLDGENGYVWNDMSKPGVYYEIEPPYKKHEQESKEEEATEQHDQKDDKQHNEQNKTEEISEESNEFENDKDNNHSKDQNTETKDVEDEKKTEMSKSGELRKPKKPNVKEDPIKELIENEQFWKWLEEWTSVYMEELTKYIRKEIKGEVKKQMKKFAQSQKDDKDKKNTPEQIEKEKKDELNKGNANTNKKPNDDSKNPNNLVKEDTKDKTEETTEKNVDGGKSKNREENDEKTKTEIDEEKVDKNTTKPVSINAKNMYGSSIGSDKVTNFFIFYPSNEIKDILTEVKPANNSKQGTFIIGTPKEDKKEDNKTDIKEISTPLIDKRTNEDLETTTVTVDKTIPSTETPIENKVDKTTTDTVESTTGPKKEEKDLEKETNPQEESSDDKKEDLKSSEKVDDNNEDVKEENDETSKDNEENADSVTEKVNEKSKEKV